jgi:hypothetical protein
MCWEQALMAILIYNLYNLQDMIIVMTTLPSPLASMRK